MTPTEITLLGLVAWFSVMVLALAYGRVSLVLAGERRASQFSPAGDDVEGFLKRATRAHANCYENLPAAAALLLYAIIAEKTAITDGLAFAFLGLRIAQSTLHLISINNLFVQLRFGAFVAQLLILLYWLLALAGFV